MLTDFVFLEREGKDRRKTSVWESNINRFPLVRAPAGDQAHNLRNCPDWESNLQPFGSWDDTQPTEPYWPRLELQFLNVPLLARLRALTTLFHPTSHKKLKCPDSVSLRVF